MNILRYGVVPEKCRLGMWILSRVELDMPNVCMSMNT